MTSVPALAPTSPLEPAAAAGESPNRRPAIPKLVQALRRPSWRTLPGDLAAGVTVALVALPLAMAFAIASGLPPEAGLWSGIVAGAVVAGLGGSAVQVGGPTGTVVVLASAIVAAHGVGGLVLCSLMAGALLIVLGVGGMGSAIRFLPRPVVVGFTNGVALLLATTQLREFLGLSIPQMPVDFIGRIAAIGGALPTTDAAAAVLGVATLLVIGLCAALKARVPGAVVALLAGTAAVWLLALPVATIDSRFHGLAAGWPMLTLPASGGGLVLALLPAAFTMAMLAGIESLVTATTADRLSGDRHNPNVELVAHGVANLAAPLTGGLPAAGSLARTAANVRAGARTPIAAVVHALALLAIAVWAAPLAALVPMPVLAAIVLMIAWSAGDWPEIGDVFRGGLTDAGVWAVTFALTVFADLTHAVPMGLALAALLFIRRAAATTDVARVTDEAVARARPDAERERPLPPFAAVFRVTGPLIFGSTDRLDAVRDRLDGLPPIVILRLRYMTVVDTTGLHALEDLARDVGASGRVFLISGAREQPLALMRRVHFDRRLGPERICATFDDALARASEIHARRFSGAWPDVGAPLTQPVDTRPESGDAARVS
jgi:SulP family sulfate permease